MANGLVVTSKTVDTGLDENQTVLAVLVLAVALHVLADGDSLLDKVVQVLGDIRSKTVRLEDTKDLVASDTGDLGNTVGVTEDNTDLGGGHTLLGVLADHVDDLIGSGLQPGRSRAAVGEGTARDTLTRSVLFTKQSISYSGVRCS